MQPMRYPWALVAIALALCSVPSARADGAGTTVVVLPWTTSKDLEIYGEPLAKALVARLRQRTRLTYQLSTGKAVTKGVDLVVDGRIVSESGDMVRLEARIRDPERGAAMATATTRRAPLAELESLAEDLAKSLAPALSRAAQQKKLPPEPAIVEPPAATSSPQRQPTMLVMRASGRAAAGAVDVDGPATQAAIELTARLGYRPVRVEQRGLLDPATARALLRAHDAPYVMSFFVERVEFDWRGVLTARGSVRVTIHDRRGIAVMDRWFTTDTLVGSRGDRHDALVYFVAEQVGFMAEPMVEKRLR